MNNVVTKEQVECLASAVKELNAAEKAIKGYAGSVGGRMVLSGELLEAAAAAVGETVEVEQHGEYYDFCYSFTYEGVQFFDLRDAPEPEPEEDDEEPAPIIDPYDLANDR